MPVIEQGADGERIFFSSTGRTLADEDQICVLSVGVDIGSSTSHLVFSRIVLERLDSRYVVTERETFYQSDILLTPYAAEDTIDADALGAFIGKQYENAMVDPEEIDAGALILTGVAVRRSNARRIGELFAAQAGKLVAGSAGDSLETVMAAHGAGGGGGSNRGAAGGGGGRRWFAGPPRPWAGARGGARRKGRPPARGRHGGSPVRGDAGRRAEARLRRPVAPRRPALPRQDRRSH